jgi:hypothetical protein
MPDDLTFSNKLPSSHASRHAWALEKYGHLLAEALRNDTSAEARAVEKLTEGQISAHIVSLILDKADPTQNKGMTAWLVGQYGQGKLRLEDLGTASETLTMFRRYAQRLEKNQRDLGQYQSLAAVWEAVIGFANEEEQHLSGKAQKALERDKAYTESRILRQDPDGFTIAVPLTEFAAKWWGKGTRWCTAAEKGNAFRQYHKDAPLIVVIIPELKEKGKFQLWATEGDVQFMDAADHSVSDVLITEYWARFERIMLHAVAQNGWALKYVPTQLSTEEMCRIAVVRDGEALRHVPLALRTKEICKIAVAQRGEALCHVPRKLRTEEMCRIAVAKTGGALYHVPERLRTEELCKIAVAQDGRALRHVPLKLRTDEVYRLAMAQNGLALGYVPQKHRRDEMCKLAVAWYGWALEYVPEKLRTEDLCKVAVAQYGRALCYVPEKLRTNEMCRIAVAQDGRALEFVPQKLRTDEMYSLAVAQNGWALAYVQEALRTDDICKSAIAQNGMALQYVPQKLRTEEMCRIAVAQNGRALQYAPDHIRTDEMCRIAVAQNGWALQCVPELLRTEELCLIALSTSEHIGKWVPDSIKEKLPHIFQPGLLQTNWSPALLDELEKCIDGLEVTPNLTPDAPCLNDQQF